MTDQTVLRLNQLNHEFYSQQGAAFAAKRQYMWPSWDRFWQGSRWANNIPSAPLSVRDIGCGSGRLVLFFQQQAVPVTYQGFDLSVELLQIARQQTAAANIPATFDQLDVVSELLHSPTLSAFVTPADCIAVFGVMHHIPSARLRRIFFEELLKSLTPDGELWITFWQPPVHKLPSADERSRVVSTLDLHETDLEPGDTFLGWKDTKSIRYVHVVQPEELELWRQTLPCTIQEEWLETAQGERGNLCWRVTK